MKARIPATCPLKSLCTAMEMLAFVGILLTLFGELAGKLFFINFFFVQWSMITEILFSITIYWCRNKVNFNWNVLKTTLAILVSQQWSVKLYIYIRCIYMDIINDRWLFFLILKDNPHGFWKEIYIGSII